MSKSARTSGGDLFAEGWLSPKAAADALGITEQQLLNRARRREIRRRELAPGTGIFVYDVKGTGR